MPPRIVQLDEEDDDAEVQAQQQNAWERAYEADRCVAAASPRLLLALVLELTPYGPGAAQRVGGAGGG